MFIKKIIINNFKIYYKNNELNFSKDRGKNIFLVSGHNGYGKTTFLTALVWCLYGKNIRDVDNNFKKEINENGGYKKYVNSILNKAALSEGEKSFFVELELTDIDFPAVPNNTVTIRRDYNIKTRKENLNILIDGKENELTKELGTEIFINDYILPKEIAKFFFFDSEKIVEFANLKSLEEKKKLSKAYSEVLGIKKYEDLKDNLKNLKLRLRKGAASEEDKREFENLEQEVKELEENIQISHNKIQVLEEEKDYKRNSIYSYQEKLIREGNTQGLDEITKKREQKEELRHKLEDLNKELKTYLDFSPFAIAFNKLLNVQQQLQKENNNKQIIDEDWVNEKLKTFSRDLDSINTINNLDSNNKKAIKSQIKKLLKKKLLNTEDYLQNTQSETLLDFDEKEHNEFNSIINNIKYSYSKRFKELVEKYKEVKNNYYQTSNYLMEVERKENDPVVKDIRNKINQLEEKINKINEEIIERKTENELNNKQLISNNKRLEKLSKKIELDLKNRQKDETIDKIYHRLEKFIARLKDEKRKSLESTFLDNINSLMHKDNFIASVKVYINTDIIDIDLFDNREQLIQKDFLSKGEQQLYATALLKTLVEESNLNFPVFIDSPLQKFDHKHTANIIEKFYPNISEQVVLFPLLEKEINEDEFNLLNDRVNSTYVIENSSSIKSNFKLVEREKLFEYYFNANYANV